MDEDVRVDERNEPQAFGIDQSNPGDRIGPRKSGRGGARTGAGRKRSGGGGSDAIDFVDVERYIGKSAEGIGGDSGSSSGKSAGDSDSSRRPSGKQSGKRKKEIDLLDKSIQPAKLVKQTKGLALLLKIPEFEIDEEEAADVAKSIALISEEFLGGTKVSPRTYALYFTLLTFASIVLSRLPSIFATMMAKKSIAKNSPPVPQTEHKTTQAQFKKSEPVILS